MNFVSFQIVLIVALLSALARPASAADVVSASPRASSNIRPATDHIPTTLLRQSPRPSWGLYIDIWGESHYQARITNAIAKYGRTPQYALFFRDLGRPFPRHVFEDKKIPGITYILSLELWAWHQKTDGYLEKINRGEYDAFFHAYARDAALVKEPFLFRFGFEMSGTWFSWGGQPQAFVAAWQRVHRIFTEEGASNAKWLWSPNILYEKEMTFDTHYKPYWPGDSLVDLIGLDGYNFGDNHDKWHTWKSYNEIFSRSIDEITRFRKPLIISETGSADDPRKAAWLDTFLVSVTSDKRIHAFVYFDYDKRSEKEPNWALDSDSTTMTRFRKWIAVP